MIPQCIYCKWFMPYGDEDEPAWCIAYPTGIPDAIYMNRISHVKHYAGDHGVVFELSNKLPPKEGELADWIKKARERIK